MTRNFIPIPPVSPYPISTKTQKSYKNDKNGQKWYKNHCHKFGRNN